MEEGSVFLTVVSLSGLLLLFIALGVGSAWYRHVHGYSFLARIRRSPSKTAILAPVVEEEDSDSDEEHVFITSNASCMGSSHAIASPAPDSSTLLHLPTELWLEVVLHTGPLRHAGAVAALRASCRALRRLLDGAAFWQSLCCQAFASWSPWMVAIGWSSPLTSREASSAATSSAAAAIGSSSSSSSAAAARPLSSSSRGQSVIEKRAWHARYVSCSRDQLLLRAAARQVLGASLPIQQLTVLHGAASRHEMLRATDAAREVVVGAPSARLAVASKQTATAAAAAAAAAADAGLSKMRHVCRATWHHAIDGSDGLLCSTFDGVAHIKGEGNGGSDDGVHISVPTSPVREGAAVAGGEAMMSSGSGHLSLWGYHAAELPSLRALWGGRGPTPTQVAKALMRRQQWRVDSLSSRVAQSCRSQRRLVPVWRRVRPDELPDLEGGAADAGGPHRATRTADALAEAVAPASTAAEAESGGVRWQGRMQQLHGLLASGGAGSPECWVAHLAKGSGVVMRALGALDVGRADSSCWMLVLTTTRHAVWVDFHDDVHDGWDVHVEI